jgi:23S rRNA pseudouridine2605 synthase
MGERLQKFLASKGLGSRRQIEEWIRQGRIAVGGTVAMLGQQVSGSETIHLDGKPVRLLPHQTRRRVLAYYKPVGEVTSRNDPKYPQTVFQRLPSLREGRWIAVGRLDLNTQGLLLLTNDGELAHRLMHPSSQIQREYAVRVLGEVESALLAELQKGVQLEDGVARFETIVDAGGSGVNHWYHVVLREGRNREVRRLWEAKGIVVSRLLRIRYGPISLRRGLHTGRWDELDSAAIDILLNTVGMTTEKLPASPQNHPKKPPFSQRGKRGSYKPR